MTAELLSHRARSRTAREQLAVDKGDLIELLTEATKVVDAFEFVAGSKARLTRRLDELVGEMSEDLLSASERDAIRADGNERAGALMTLWLEGQL